MMAGRAMMRATDNGVTPLGFDPLVIRNRTEFVKNYLPCTPFERECRDRYQPLRGLLARGKPAL